MNKISEKDGRVVEGEICGRSAMVHVRSTAESASCSTVDGKRNTDDDMALRTVDITVATRKKAMPRTVVKSDGGEIKGGKRRGNSSKDHATKLNPVQQSVISLTKLDVFSSGCTPFRKVVETKGKRLQTEVEARPSKKRSVQEARQMPDETQTRECLPSDCRVLPSYMNMANSDVIDNTPCDYTTVDNQPASKHMSVLKECTHNLRVDLSDYKYCGRKRIVGEDNVTCGDAAMTPEKNRQSKVDKNTSDEVKSRGKVQNNAEIRGISCNDSAKMMAPIDESIELTEVGGKETEVDGELATELDRREEEKLREEELTEKRYIFCQICHKQLNHLSLHRRHLHVNNCTQQVSYLKSNNIIHTHRYVCM